MGVGYKPGKLALREGQGGGSKGRAVGRNAIEQEVMDGRLKMLKKMGQTGTIGIDRQEARNMDKKKMKSSRHHRTTAMMTSVPYLLEDSAFK